MRKKIFIISILLIFLVILICFGYDYVKYGQRIEDIPELYDKVEEYLPNLYETKYGEYIQNLKTFIDVEELGMYKMFNEIHVYTIATYTTYYVENSKLWLDSINSKTCKFIFENNEIVGYQKNELPKHIIKEYNKGISVSGNSDVELIKQYYGEELYNTIYLKNITMTIKKETLTNTGATVVIEDKNENPYWYGRWFRIDKKENGEWKEVTPINDNYVFTEEGIAVGEDGILEIETNWSELYGELEKGEYRIVKEQYETEYKYVFAEFEIE